jgi:hypothetical protein
MKLQWRRSGLLIPDQLKHRFQLRRQRSSKTQFLFGMWMSKAQLVSMKKLSL